MNAGVRVQVDKQTRMSAAERREQLLDVTKQFVLDQGFHAVSIEAVARAAGVSRPIVYGHFKDLAGLLQALTERESVRALGQLSDSLLQDLDKRDPRQELLRGLTSYLEAVRADPGTWSLVLMPPEGAPELLRERIEQGRAAVVAQLAEAIRPGFGPGRESPDPELTAALLSAFADQCARMVLTQPERYPVERVVDHARWWLDQLGP
jgi:AcrR family transcriptional regulator